MTLRAKSFGGMRLVSKVALLVGSVVALMPGVAQAGDTQSRGVIVLRPTAATPAVPAAGETTATAVAAVTPAALPSNTAVATQPLAVTSAPAAPAVTSVGNAPAGPMACARPFAQPSLQLGQAQFDRKLSRLLKNRPASAVVDLPQPYQVSSSAPAALDGWLSEVKASGGFVSVTEYCQQSRGLFGFLRRMFGGGAKDAYKAAAGYDAVLHTDGAEQVVTQVEFRRRAS